MAKLLVTLLVMLFASHTLATETLSVFETGNLSTVCCHVNQSQLGDDSPPKPLLIVRPVEDGTYPVILFLHGTCLQNSYYTQLFEHIASHGYILVAPQLYGCTEKLHIIFPWELDIPKLPVCGDTELEWAAQVAKWLYSGLQSVLPGSVKGDLQNKLALAGHSRGGKIAFALALGKAKTSLQEVNISALLGVDPVAGLGKECSEPIILRDGTFDLSVPVTIIGTGLGDQPKHPHFPFWPACAPDNLNHKEFFSKSKPPKGHFVITEYGLLDMLNDDLTSDFVVQFFNDLCTANGSGSNAPMRRGVGGITVAFLEYNFQGKTKDYLTIVRDRSAVSPVKLDDVEFDPAYLTEKTPDSLKACPQELLCWLWPWGHAQLTSMMSTCSSAEPIFGNPPSLQSSGLCHPQFSS
ncbi:hypothetical protein JCGZ_21878 [Jatropha curcas]|uniref:Uncharacterized protein n=1 Tax=Jatropha curcas TaxID=180498 RepID=A0A067JC69_JATCU|nr:hypothetical protein JCGZ_21878 [Jatropha curcas]